MPRFILMNSSEKELATSCKLAYERFVTELASVSFLIVKPLTGTSHFNPRLLHYYVMCDLPQVAIYIYERCLKRTSIKSIQNRIVRLKSNRCLGYHFFLAVGKSHSLSKGHSPFLSLQIQQYSR